jgi:hypothetical protein
MFCLATPRVREQLVTRAAGGPTASAVAGSPASSLCAVADELILRVTDATGEAYDDPSEYMLFMLFEDLEPWPDDRS